MSAPWLEAVIKSEDHIGNGAVEDINLDGLNLRMKNQNQELFLCGERIAVDLYLRDANRRYIMMKMQARIVLTDEPGVRVRFNPMTLSQHRKLEALIEFMSAEEGSDRDRCEEILFTELLDDYRT